MGACVSRSKKVNTKDLRLPTDAIPSHYDLSLTPKFDGWTFEGRVIITVQIQESTSKLTLNSVELEIGNTSWKGDDGDEQTPTVVEDTTNERITFRFEKPLEAGEGKLTINFNGNISEKWRGLYRLKTMNAKGKEVSNAVSQFQPTHARRCFPCWDEPDLLATFDLNLFVAKIKVPLSNMPVKKTKASGKVNQVTFQTTPLISTYLIAIIVCNFEFIEESSTSGICCRLYAPPGKTELGQFALETAVKAMDFFEEYFETPFPLPKLDLVAISDFSEVNGVENWGIVTFKETSIFIEESVNDNSTREEKVALAVCQRVALQWFGNLVSTGWWTNFWLKESCSMLLAYIAVDDMFPDNEIWNRFAAEIYTKAQKLDSLSSSHAIEVPVLKPTNMNSILDSASLLKGASVLRMLREFVGQDEFRDGLRQIVLQHSNEIISPGDLWTALEEVSAKSVTTMMPSWIKQIGFPLVHIEFKEEYVYTLTQERYKAATLEKKKPIDKDPLWVIPITMCSAKSCPRTLVDSPLFSERTIDLNIPSVEPHDWIKMNPNLVGFYRINYSLEMIVHFVPAIRKKLLSVADRLSIISDFFAMVMAGLMTTDEMISILVAFSDEEDYFVWTALDNVAGSLNALLSYTEFADKYRAYARTMLSRLVSRFGWKYSEEDSAKTLQLRTLILSRMAVLEDSHVINRAKELFEDHASGTEIVPTDLRTALYRCALVEGTDETWETIQRLYEEGDQFEKQRIANALGYFKDEDLLKQVLEFAISEGMEPAQTVRILLSACATKDGRKTAWKFFKANWQDLSERCESGALLIELVTGMCEGFATEAKAREIKSFFRNHACPGLEEAVPQIVENIRINTAWIAREHEVFKSIFYVQRDMVHS